MAEPVPAGKLQLCRGVAAKRRELRAAVLRALTAALAAAPLCCASGALAAQPATSEPHDLIVSSTLERIAAAAPETSGDVRITSDTVASHADQLIVSVRFTNASRQVLDSVRITSPVPADVQYVADSASGPGSDVLFSADNGRTFGRPDELTIAAANGSSRAAEAADYTHVRWVLKGPLAAGATGVARYRAVPR
jgi:hypothetical protein